MQEVRVTPFAPISAAPYGTSIKVCSEYEVIAGRRIGDGNFGQVFRGRNIHTNTVVAVKEIDFKKYTRANNEQQLMREIEIMKNLSQFHHPNIVQLHEWERVKDQSSDGMFFRLVMEYCDSGTLSDLLDKYNTQSPMPELEAKELFTQLASALKFLHQHNIVHRDLKPENLLLTRNKQVPDLVAYTLKLADFGLSREAAPLMETHLGTPLYMAPEIYLKKRFSSKSDLFSVGVMLYRAVYGKHPFLETERGLYEFHKQGFELVRPDNTPHVSLACWQLISKLLVKSEQKRINWDDFFKDPWFGSIFELDQPHQPSSADPFIECTPPPSSASEDPNKLTYLFNLLVLGDIKMQNPQLTGVGILLYKKALVALKTIYIDLIKADRTNPTNLQQLQLIKPRFNEYLAKLNDAIKVKNLDVPDESCIPEAIFARAIELGKNGIFYEACKQYNKCIESYCAVLSLLQNQLDENVTDDDGKEMIRNYMTGFSRRLRLVKERRAQEAAGTNVNN